MKVASSSDPFDGIFSFLYKSNPSNFEKIVEASGEKNSYLWGEPIVALIPTFNGSSKIHNWVSKNIQNANITIRMIEHSLLVTSYSIKTRTDIDVANFPRGWKLEGSQDSNEWYTLHSINNTSDLAGTGLYKQYECFLTDFFTSFRVVQTQNNSNNNGIFHISQLELFVFIDLISPHPIQLSCFQRNFIFIVSCLLITFFLTSYET